MEKIQYAKSQELINLFIRNQRVRIFFTWGLGSCPHMGLLLRHTMTLRFLIFSWDVQAFPCINDARFLWNPQLVNMAYRPFLLLAIQTFYIDGGNMNRVCPRRVHIFKYMNTLKYTINYQFAHNIIDTSFKVTLRPEAKLQKNHSVRHILNSGKEKLRTFYHRAK